MLSRLRAWWRRLWATSEAGCTRLEALRRLEQGEPHVTKLWLVKRHD